MRSPSLAFALAVLLIPACGGGDQGPDAAIPPELVGVWVAEPSCAPPCTFTLTMTKNTIHTLDLVAAAFELDIKANGAATLSSSIGSANGSLEVSGSRMVLRDSGTGAADTADWSVQGSYLHLDFQNEITAFDLDGDQVEDAAHAMAVFEKR